MERDSASTYVFCRNRKGEWCILAGRRKYGHWKDKWNVPVGGVHKGEDNRVGAKRECQEETGGKYRLSDFKLYSKFNGFCGVCCQYYVIYKDRTYKHRLTHGDGENTPFQWIPISEVDDMDWAYNMKSQVKKIFKSKVEPKPKKRLFIDRQKRNTL